MLLFKNIPSLTIVAVTLLAPWQTTVSAATPVYSHIPATLVKAERSVARGQPDRVIQLLGNKVENLRRPEMQAIGYGLLCQAHYQKEDYVSAEKFCDKAATTGAPNWSHLNNRGVMRVKLERYDEALVDFKRSASIMLASAPTAQMHSVKRNISSTSERIEPMRNDAQLLASQ
ncbi:MAG: hypothetical protein V7742_06920 [Halioglobus sp.]